jgi:hypothetical protein
LLPELRWSFDRKKHSKRKKGSLLQKETIASADLNSLVHRIARGSEEQVGQAARDLLQAGQTQTAIAPLLQIADGSKTKDHFRREAAILVLGRIGGSQAAQGLIRAKKTPEYGPATCYALGCIGDPVALPYLLGLVRDGYPIALNWNLSPQQEKDLSVIAHAYALIAIGLIGDSGALDSLVLDANKEFLSTKYSDSSGNPLTNSSNLGLVIVGSLYDSWKTKRLITRATSIMVHPGTPLSAVIDCPGDTRRMWMYQLRISITKILAGGSGAEPLLKILPRARQVIQRLIAALSALEFDPKSIQCLNLLSEGARSANKEERILAYDGYIKNYVRTHDPAIIPWGLAGLKDSNQVVRGAVASSILFNRAEAWYPQTFELLKSPSVDTRTSLVVPLMLLAAQNDDQATAMLESVMKNDKDKSMREWIADFWKDLPDLRLLYEFENGSASGENGAEDSEIPGTEEPPISFYPQNSPSAIFQQDGLKEAGISSQEPFPEEKQPTTIPLEETKIDSRLNIFCMLCGFRLPEDALFCPRCGTSIQSQ